MPTIPQLQMPDIVGNYAKGQEIKYQKDERARKQPIMEQMEKLNLKKAELANKALSSSQTLRDHELKTKQEEARDEQIKEISTAASWVLSQPEEQRPQAYEQAMGFFQQEGVDASVMTPENLGYLANIGAQDRAGTNKSTYGSQSTLKDSEGNLWGVSQERNSTGGVKSVFNYMGGDKDYGDNPPSRPIGKSEIVEDYGMGGDEKISFTRKKKQQEMAGSASVKDAAAYADKVEVLNDRQDQFEYGINLLEKQGARTGRIEKIFPDLIAATQELSQLQKDMALTVVQMTTFGALSKGELDVAKDVAFPSDLNEKQLAQWMRNRKSYESKIKDLYVEYMDMANSGMTKAEIVSAMEKKRSGISRVNNKDNTQALIEKWK